MREIDIGEKITFDIKYNFSDYLDNNPTIVGTKINENNILIEDIIKDTVEYGTSRYSMLGLKEGSYIEINNLNIRDKIDINLFKQNISRGNILVNNIDIDKLNINDEFLFLLNKYNGSKELFRVIKITNTLLRIIE